MAVALAACAAPERPNLVLVSVDTLRADALGAYGGPVPTPAFDGLAAAGVLFEQAIAPAPETAASHATLFTADEVQRHGVTRNGARLDDGLVTLAEVFRAAGYRTAAFVSSFVLDPRFGWSQGFETYDATFPRAGETVHNRTGFWGRHEFDGFDRRAPATNDAALAWLRDAPEPFLLFVHYFDPHAPNAPGRAALRAVPTAFAQRRAERWIGLLGDTHGGGVAELRELIRAYHAEVVVTDAALGGLLAALDARGLAGRTIVAVTADHGEGLGQHGLLDHAAHLYEEQLRVPLLMRWPGRLAAGARVRATLGLVDLAPTLAQLAGLQMPEAVDGRSHAAALRAGREPESRPVIARRRHYPRRFGGQLGTKFSVRTERWKYIRATDDPDELYDLERDPEELDDVWRPDAPAVRELGALLDAHLAAHPRVDRAPELDADERRALEALGYGTR